MTALVPLLLLGVGATVAWLAWRFTRRPALHAVAAEADARGGLNDELTSACWFARDATPSAWEALMLNRAAQRAHTLDARAIFPLRLPRSLAAAAALGTAVLLLTLGSHSTIAPADPGAALIGNAKAEARAGANAATVQGETAFGLAAMAAASAQKADELWTRAEALARSLKSGEEQAELQRAIKTGDVGRVRELVERAEQEVHAASAGPDARARAGQVSAEAAQSLLERLQALLADGSEPKTGDAVPTGENEDKKAKGPDDGTERRDAEQHTTMDALNDALRALGQAATGNEPMANSPPGLGVARQCTRQHQRRRRGHARKHRATQAKAARTRRPRPRPKIWADRCSESPRHALRHACSAWTTRLPEGDPHALGGEGAYAATQAQTARVGLSAVQAARPGASDAAIAREQIPVAYRASVKRYFLTEHGKGALSNRRPADGPSAVAAQAVVFHDRDRSLDANNPGAWRLYETGAALSFTALSPAAALGLIFAVAGSIWLLYLIKPRKQRVATASTLLWRRVVEAAHTRNTRWRWLLSLLLALAIGLSLALALTRPQLPRAGLHTSAHRRDPGQLRVDGSAHPRRPHALAARARWRAPPDTGRRRRQRSSGAGHRRAGTRSPVSFRRARQSSG